jgi:hypothetical protein
MNKVISNLIFLEMKKGSKNLSVFDFNKQNKKWDCVLVIPFSTISRNLRKSGSDISSSLQFLIQYPDTFNECNINCRNIY